MPNKLSRSLLLCSLLAGFCLAQQTTAPATSSAHFTPREDRYRLHPSDVLDLAFSFTPEYNQTVTIQPDGFVSLKDAGDLKLGGLTSDEATAAITAKYSTTLHDPSITLALKEFSRPSYIIAGEVTKPGKYELHDNVTLSDAIAIAGGFVMGAKQSEVILFRRVQPDLAEVKKFDVKRMLAAGQLKEDPMLRPGDSIYISKSAVGKLDTFMKVSRLGLYFPLP